MGQSTGRSAAHPGTVRALMLVVAVLCALVIDCTTVHHDEHHEAGLLAAVVAAADHAVPDHPLPDHCLADTAVADSGLVLPALGLFAGVVLVLLASLGHPALAPRAPPHSSPRCRRGRDILCQICICRR
ncbi:hypothetical protein NN3_43360 [Nocardia neocaledoniensis NBRC 108232]|uniref:Uncharacterized protein n=1 Tax=Nocardia neocaledoniensis TaxID=236511 RepID=A0A317N2F3_9NOCA|nr:hypothetical protein [Nocardia neocaledoniensis]PWV68730.1 hypothetical protein DFR69_11749 [Nocardia neocaledoniensis]GEM33329.1 hypothetical protein NN3_43360 [Nocardia neocaledoniensis NBRC 108232]